MSRRFAAGALILFKDPKTGERFVLLQRRSELEHEPLSWSVYGGEAEPGETPAECMLREVDEEAGFDLSRLSRVAVYTHHEACNEFAFHTFAVNVPRKLEPKHSRETLEAKWFLLGKTPETLWENLPQPLHSGMEPMIRNQTATKLVDMVA
ncbi:MAG: NUDIX hydrolase [Verrucomicrobiaceae bacterium]|nr:MAG: NUDIX hydrolase [Verrucomicrobiaceae bacterium]